ncbi:hypothetical protein FSP39_018263 [Pinctada imbricata]|uniref:DNA polymerase zeta catalytic subunit n=1 Tax=Pinctada imbricata TaxID=66713 RepID=A0AA89BXR2_PINIB|nr:hypothetical protein FSP39_018263 [Pinctada imbricata]
MFGLRIVTTDHYQATPIPGLDVLHSDFRSADVYKVPVIRIYGSTPAGQKTCMHVHGVFPYLYVLYDGTQPWDRYMRLFATSLDKAINVAQGQPSSNVQHVFKIVLVSGIPMYGFHPKEQQFLKIYFYNPGIIRKAADLLLGGAVMNKNFQPHESHIPYTLQMFIDYNLYGMNLINVAALKFRRKNKDDNGNPVDNENSQKSDELKFSPRTPVASLTDIIDTSVLKSPSATQLWDDDTIPRDSQSDVTSEDSQEGFPGSQSASMVDMHLSQSPEDYEGSQDTVMVEEEEEEDKPVPIVSLDSIKRVVSMSQSFSLPSSGPSDENEDRSLAQILASLADESSPPSSQAAAGQVSVLEEKDSILLEKPIIPDDEVVQNDDQETLEMSQVVWDDGSQGQEDKTLGEGEQFDLAGLDSTWNDSQMPAHQVEEDYDSPTIPQLDGASDEKPKPAQKRVRKKRLGTNGPVSTFDQMVAEARKHGVDVNNIQRPGMYGNPPNMMSGMGPRMNQPAFNPMHSGFQNQNFGNYGNSVRGNLDWTSQNPRPQLGGNQWNPNQQMPWTQMLNSPDEMPNYMVNARPSLDGNNSQQGLSSPQGMNLSMSQQTVRSPQGQLSPHGSMASPQGVPSSTERSPYQRGAPSNTSVNPPHCFPSPLGKTSSDQVPSSPIPGGQLEVRNTSQEMVSPGAMRSPSTAIRPPTETISSPSNPPLSSSVQSQPINMTSSSFNHQGVTHSGSQISSSSGLNASYDSASPHRLSASDVSSPHSNMSSHGSVSSPHNSLQSPVGQIRNPNNMNSIYNNTMNTSNPQYSPAQEQLSPMGNNSSWESSQSYLEQLNGFQNQYQSPFTMSQQQPSQHMQPASYPVDQYHPFPVQQYHSQQQSQGAQQQMTSSQELDLSRNYTSPVSQASHSYGSNTAERESYQLNSNQSGNIDYSPSSLQQSNRSHVSSPSSQMYGINLSKRSESASSLGPQNDSSMNRRPSISSGHSNSRSSFNDSQMEHSNSSMPEEQVLNNSQPVPLPTSISDPTKGNSSLLNSLQEAFNFAGNHLRDMNSSQSNTSFSQSSGGPGFGTGNGGMMGQQQNSNMGNRGMMGQQQNSNMGNSYQSQTINSTSQVYQRQVSAEGMHSNQGDRNQMSGNYQGQPGQFHMQTNSFGDSGGIMHQNTGGHMSSVTYNQGGSSYYGNYGMPQSNSQMPQNTYGSGGYYPPQQSGYGQDGTMIQNYGMPGAGQPHGNDGKTPKQRKPRKPREKKEKVPGETKKRTYKKRTSFMCVDPAKSVVPTGQTQEGKNLLEKLLLAPEEEEERIANSAMLDRNGCSDRSQSSSNSNMPSSYAQNQSQSSSSLLSSTSSTSENITKDFCSDHSKGNSSVSALSHAGNTCNNISESLHSNVGIPPNTNDSLTVQVEKKRRGRPPKNSSIRSLQNFVSTHKTQYGMKVTKIATEGKFKQRSSPKLVKFSDSDQSQRTAQSDLMNRDPTVYLPDDDNLSPTYMTLDDSFNSGYNKPTSVEELLVQRSRLDSYVDPESKILHRYSIDTDKSPANDESVKKKKGKLVRSLSTPEPGKKRRGRPPKNPELKAAERMRSLSTVSEISDMDDFKIRKSRKKAKAKNSTSDKYTFVFHIPSYSFKKVKLIDMGRLRQDLGFVRMHPMDARRYSLLKVGRELVRIPKLSMQHIAMGKMGQTEDLQELLKMSGVDVMMKRKSSMIGYEAETQALMEAIEKENLTKISNTTKDNVEVMVVQEKQRLSEIIPETNCFNIEKVALSSIIDHCLKTNIGVENSDSDSVVKADVSESPSTGCEVRTYSSGTVLDSAHTSNTKCQGHQGNQENSKSESNGVETSCSTIEELMEKKIKESNGIVNDQEQQQGLPNDTLSKVSDVPASSKVSDVPASSNVSDQPTEVQSEDKQEKASDIVSKAPNNVITPATSQFQPLVSETGSQKKECGPDKAKDASRSKVRKERKYSAKTIRKQNKLKLHKKLPLVIDPDQEEHDDVILHDVSLLEASDGRLTPVRSRTPITGRSPIRQNYNPDQYQLVGADILCSKDDLDNKWKMSDIGSDGASVTKPYYDESSLDSLFSGPKKSRLSLFKRKELEVIEISSSEDSNLEPPVNKKLVVNVENALTATYENNTEDPIIEINDSNSDLDSSISKGDKLFSNKRKKKLTKSQRLHMAFNSASYKTRRKRSPVHSGKLMANLSLLHQATLANLNDNENENMEGYGDCLDDYKAPYEDAMFKMSLLSPHSSEAGDMSPPQPLSPGEVSGDVCAAMRSTSEVLSPVMSTTSNSSPVSSLTGSDMSPVYPPTAVNCVDNYNLAVDESPLKTPSYAQGVTPERRDVSAKRKILDDGVVDSRDNFPVNEICSPQSNTSVVDESCITQNSDQSGTNVTDNTKCTSSSQGEEIEEIQCKNTDDLSSSDKNSKLEGKDEIVRTKELTQSEESDSDNVIQSSQECTDSRATSKFDTMKNCSSVRTSIPSTSGMNLRENDGSISDNTEDKRLCRKRKFEVRHTERKAVVKLKPLSVNEIEKYSSFSKDVCSPDNTLSVSSCENQMEQCDSLSQSGDQSLFSDSAMMLSPGNSSQGGEVPLNDDNMDTEIKGTSSVKNAEKLGSGTANSRSNSQNSNSPPNPRASSIGLTLSRGNQKLVYMPSRRPPSRESVTKTAVSYGLGTSVNQDAFYSNPDDAMEKPKEVGGRLLSVQSSRVRELPEFEHSIDCTGLTTVRKIIASENNILDSQIDNESLFERLSKDLDFKFALFGDRTVTIAPVKPPPSKSLVELWIQKHDIYKDLKLKINGKANSSVKKDEKKEKCSESVTNLSDNKNRKSALKIVHKEKSYSRQSSFGSECKLQTSKSEPTREVSFDEKVEKFSLTKSFSDSEVSEDLTCLASDRIDLCSTTNQKKDEIDDKMDEKIDEMDDDIISPSPPKSPIRSIPKDKMYMSHSMAKRIKLNIEDQSVSPSVSIAGTYTSLKNPRNLNASTPKSTSSSTPLRIKRLDKLFQASFTPIAKNQSQGEPNTVKQESDTKKGKDTGFLTPKKIPLPRRLSINSVNRKLIPSGQDYSTPRNQKDMSQIDGPTPKNSFGFKVSQQNLQDAKALHEVQNLTVISLELHAETRRDLRPDPEVDPVQALFYVIHHEVKDADP